MTGYSVRPFCAADSGPLHEITVQAIREIAPADYTAQQIAVWSARHNNAETLALRASLGALIFVAITPAGQPAAFALLEPDGHLDQLYCSPEHSRMGLAGRLLSVAEARARKLGTARLFTEASELARPVFARAGYTLIRRQDFDLDSVAIHNYAMEKLLG